MARGYNIGQIVSISMFLGHGPLSLMYGVFTHISEYVKESSCPGKTEVKVGIWEL